MEYQAGGGEEADKLTVEFIIHRTGRNFAFFRKVAIVCKKLTYIHLL